MKDPQKGDVIAESAVRFVRALPAPPDRAWRFLTDTALLPEWYGEGRIEGREGGAVSLMGGHVRGVVTRWRPATFLAYSWNVFSPGEAQSRWPVSYLEFALEAADGGTRLTLTHRPIPAAMQNQTLMGWHTMLDLIAAAARGDFPKRAELFPQNAALYGVDPDKLEKAPQ
jgi:uncharacterized protein YndB with AHSA1/START domain